jgi:thioredoxin-like negative regulator of GroEL
MNAMVHLSRGELGEALRALRAARVEAEAGSSPAELCQAALALGVALAVAGRPDEALLEALDALARAREAGDKAGANACLAFLAKLFASVERPDDAVRLRRASEEGAPASA